MGAAEFQQVCERAMAVGRDLVSGAPNQHYAAFANGVAEMVTKSSGGHGGPSIREHRIANWAAEIGMNGDISFEQAVEIALPLAFGPMAPSEAARIFRAYEDGLFDDTPEDLELARKGMTWV